MNTEGSSVCRADEAPLFLLVCRGVAQGRAKFLTGVYLKLHCVFLKLFIDTTLKTLERTQSTVML